MSSKYSPTPGLVNAVNGIVDATLTQAKVNAIKQKLAAERQQSPAPSTQNGGVLSALVKGVTTDANDVYKGYLGTNGNFYHTVGNALNKIGLKKEGDYLKKIANQFVNKSKSLKTPNNIVSDILQGVGSMGSPETAVYLSPSAAVGDALFRGWANGDSVVDTLKNAVTNAVFSKTLNDPLLGALRKSATSAAIQAANVVPPVVTGQEPLHQGLSSIAMATVMGALAGSKLSPEAKTAFKDTLNATGDVHKAINVASLIHTIQKKGIIPKTQVNDLVNHIKALPQEVSYGNKQLVPTDITPSGEIKAIPAPDTVYGEGFKTDKPVQPVQPTQSTQSKSPTIPVTTPQVMTEEDFLDSMLKTAQGKPDLKSTQAARKLLDKRGIDWRNIPSSTIKPPETAELSPSQAGNDDININTLNTPQEPKNGVIDMTTYKSGDKIPEGYLSKKDITNHTLFSMMGNKQQLLSYKGYQDIYKNLLKNSNRVVDAFAGTGLNSNISHAFGFTGEVLKNEGNEFRHAILKATKENPDALIKDMHTHANVISKDVETLNNVKDKKAPIVKAVRQKIKNYMVNMIHKKNVGAYLMAHLSNFLGAPLEKAEGYSPALSIDKIKGANISNLRKVKNGIESDIIKRISSLMNKYNHKVFRDDSWKFVKEHSKPGDAIIFDSDYVEKENAQGATQKTTGYDKMPEFVNYKGEKVKPKIPKTTDAYIKTLDEEIMPLLEKNDRKILITNAYNSKLYKALKDRGFDVYLADRKGGHDGNQTEREIIAVNFNRDGKIIPVHRNIERIRRGIRETLDRASERSEKDVDRNRQTGGRGR